MHKTIRITKNIYTQIRIRITKNTYTSFQKSLNLSEICVASVKVYKDIKDIHFYVLVVKQD